MSDPDRWAVVERIYHEAMERPVADRPAFLEAACAGDVVLRRELDSLLATDGASFLDQSALDVAAREMTPPSTVSWVGRAIRHYEAIALIGVGGMGEVYRARDRSLGREVALKLLPQEVSKDPERLRRLEREARMLASLNHAGIATLFGLEEHDGQRFLVMELVPGQTLAERVRHGGLPIRDALDIGRQIAEGLEAAHDAGVVHRDLKPANVKVTPDGRVKLLDFGLAKAVAPTPGGVDPTLTASEATREGTVLGTPAYMSPEQARGQPVDRRTDIWAFGCCLYESLTGERAFQGGTVTDTLAAVLNTEPDWDALSEDVPLVARRLLRRCLVKEARHRLQHIGDARVELEDIGIDASAPSAPARRSSRAIPAVLAGWVPWIVVAAVVSAAVVATALVLRRPEPIPPPVSRTELLLPARLSLHDWLDGPVISPDGRTVAFTGVMDGTRRLYLRPVNASVIKPLPGTEGASRPFWSPDGRAIGFSVYDQIRRVDVTGGAVVTLGEFQGGFLRTATWNGEGVVLFDGWFGGGGDPLIRRMGERGTATAVTRLDASRKERSHGFPQFLPDGQHFLYFADAPEPALYVGSLGSTNVTPIADIASPGRYAAGHLLYTQQRTLIARPFDPVRLEFRGAEFPLEDEVVSGRFSASQNGTIAYRRAESDFMTLVWFDRHGSRHGTLGEPAEYRQVVLSPSGAHVAVVRGDPISADLWMAESAKGVFSRLTRDPGRESDPAWSPDERYLAYSKTEVSLGMDDVGLRVVRKDLVTGTDQPVAGAAGMYLDDWTADGRSLICRGESVFAVPASGAGASVALLRADIDEIHVSPDGHWVAYNSDESGEFEVYVASFPDFARKRQVSVAGGLQPHWRRDGRELFYMTPHGSVMSVAIRTVPELATETPVTLFTTNLVPTPGWSQYGVSPDGQRFLVMESSRQFFTLLQHRLTPRAESQ